jgi:putative ABC transport system permease protein
VRGRFFADDDRLGREPVALISEAFARSFFGGDDPIGSRLRVSGGTNQYARIIGVVGDIRDQSLEQAPRPMYFMAQAQAVATTGDAIRQATFVLRSDRDPSLLGAALRGVIREVDPSLPVYAVRTYEGAVAQSVARPRFATLLLAVFATFGLGLGWLGVYGVLAYTVAERTVELGIRRALGAPSSGLIRLVLVQGLRPVFVGVGAGLLTAAAASGVLRAQLFGVSPTDPATYVVVATGVLAAALLACMTPTLRALRVSPLAALRDR